MTLALPALLLLAAPDLRGMPQVELTLSKGSAFWNGNQALVVCEAVIDNRTGGGVAVATQFASAFDILFVVVRDEKGKELLRQAYVAHQSPFVTAREFTLKKGENKQELRFPVDLPKGTGTIRVSLAGRLPHAGHDHLLLSDVVEVKIGPAK